MPLFPPNTAYGRLGGSWRTWDTPWIHRSGSWEQAKRVWVYSAGSWRIVWTATTTDALNPVATINGTGVDITWDAPAGDLTDPEVVENYSVRRSDGSLVGSVAAVGGSYQINDPLPLVGTHAYTIESEILGVVYSSVVTNTVTLGVVSGTPVATTSNVGIDTDVTVVYGTAPGAVAYNIYDVNGTFVGQPVPVDHTVFTDSDPNAGVGGYSVEAVMANGDTGPLNESNSLTLAQAPTSLQPVGGDGFYDWSLASAGDHDDVQALVNGVVVETMPAGTTGRFFDGELQDNAGTVIAITVRTRISGNNGPLSNQVDAPSVAEVPISVTAAATGTLGQLKLTWGNPAGSRTGYRVQADDGGWFEVGDNTSPSYYTWAASTGSRSMRVRTTSDGGPSAYVTASATPLWDNSPPALPTITSFKPESSYGRMVIRFTTSSSDNNQYEVNWRINGGGWNFGNIWNSVGNSQAVSQVLTTTPNDPGGYLLETRVRVRDQYQNTSGWTSTWNYTTEESPIIVAPNSSGHWRSGTYGQNTSNPTRVYQGYFSNPSYNYYGYFYYGTQIADRCNAIGTVGGDKTVTNMRNYLIREGGGNNVADCVYVGTHTMTTNPGFVNGAVAPLSSVSCIGTLTYGQGAWMTLPSTARSALVNGSQRGVGCAAPTGKPYMFLYPYTTTFQGWIEITHLG